MRRRWQWIGLVVLGISSSAVVATASQLEFLEFHRQGVAGVGGLGGANSVALSLDGRFVYVGDHDDPNYEGTIAIFSRSVVDGRLEFVGVANDVVNGVDVLTGIVDVAVSSDGLNVYASGGDAGPGTFNNRIVVFARDIESGLLEVVEVETEGVGGPSPANPRGPYLSPDGLSVYAPTSNGDSIVVWSRDPASGELTYLQTLQDGQGGISGLRGGTGAGVSPDGLNVYGVGILDNAISAFSRNPMTGELTFIDSYADGAGGVDGLGGVYRLAVSPDGGNVYGAAFNDSAIAVFRREPGTGALQYLEAHFEGLSGVAGLDRANAVALSPDGRLLIAKGWGSVAVFVREPVEGRLTFLEAFYDGVDGVDGIAAGSDVSVSPDGRNVYASGHDDDALAVFTIVSAGPVELGAARDGFLRQGAPDTNEGGNDQLRIQSSGKNRVLVAFDLSGVDRAGLVRATLRLTISDIANNWGTSGRTVSAHRLLAPWSEGNGWTVGGNDRGSGAGVTWACPSDSDIANQSPNCAGNGWSGGLFDPAMGPAVLHTNNMTGEVIFDVTSDVRQGADFGWLLAKDQEGQPGKVYYFSKEGAELAGNPGLAPQLVLEYE